MSNATLDPDYGRVIEELNHRSRMDHPNTAHIELSDIANGRMCFGKPHYIAFSSQLFGDRIEAVLLNTSAGVEPRLKRLYYQQYLSGFLPDLLLYGFSDNGLGDAEELIRTTPIIDYRNESEHGDAGNILELPGSTTKH